MKKQILLIIIVTFLLVWKGVVGNLIAQQDPQYTMYMFNQLAINPGYAGSKEALCATGLIRAQWTGFDGAPRTETLTLHGPIRKKKVGLGISLIADQIGPVKSIGLMGSYAYRIKIKKGKLALGLRAGVYNYSYNWNDVTFKDQNDLYNTHNKTSIIVPTADAGIYYYTNSAYIGLAATHLYNGRLTTQSNLNGDDAKLSPHYFFTAGKGWEISPRLILNPSICVKGSKGAPFTLDLNLSAQLDNKIWIGISGRTVKDALLFVEFNITERLKLGYAFDWGFSQLAWVGGSSHELMLSYDFSIFKSRMLSPRHIYF